MCSNVAITCNLSSEGTPVNDMLLRTNSFQMAFFAVIHLYFMDLYRWKAAVARLWYLLDYHASLLCIMLLGALVIIFRFSYNSTSVCC